MSNAATIGDPPIRKLSTVLREYRDSLPDGADVSVDNILEALHERGFGIVLLLFAGPLAVPFTPPGLNIVLAAPLLFLTAQQMMGAHTIWMPPSLRKKTLPSKTLKAGLEAVIPWQERIEALLRPRLGWATQDGPSRLFGFFGVIMALTAMIPVPGTNSVPSLGIALMAAGTAMRDGLAVLAGAVIGTGWAVMIAAGVFFLGPDALHYVTGMVKSALGWS